MAANGQINENDLDNEDFAEDSATLASSKAAHWTYKEPIQKTRHDYHDFKEEIERSLKRVGYNQTKLADAMGCHYTVLNRKLSGVRALKISHLKQIIKFMVEWGAFTDIAAIEALLKLRNLNLTIFTGEDWNSTPLCKLANAAVFADSATGSATPKAGKGTTRPRPVSPLPAPAAPLPVIRPVTPPHNLPLLTRATFIGRKRELTYLSSMLSDQSASTKLQTEAEQDNYATNPVRLLTLTGPGGIGKTTLAQQLGAELLRQFEQGVYFVDLSDIRQLEHLPGTIARTIGLNEVKGIAIEHTLKNHLKARSMLLILDNFEQILEAGLFVNELIEVAPRVRVIVTSRELLHLRNEQEYIVPLMSVPNLKSRKQAFMPSEPTDPTANELSGYEAVALFVQRAKEARRSFTLTDENAKTVAEVCVKLEGLPLAIELAASRVKTLSPQQILELLTPIVDLQDSQKGRPSRHQTLRAVIDWSYELLNAKEQDLLRTLSVFASGFTFSAVVTVYGEKLGQVSLKKKQTATLNLLTSLIDKSLLRTVEEVTGAAEPVPENPETRYTMLESIREYALELLEENQEEATQVRNWHATYYLNLAEEAEPILRGGGQQVEWLTRLYYCHNNFRVALQWLIDSQNAELANQFASVLSEYWLIRSHFTEGQEWLKLTLSLVENYPTAVATKAKAFKQAGRLSEKYDLAYSEKCYVEAKRLYQEINDLKGMAFSSLNLGNIYYVQYKYNQATELYKEAVEIAERNQDFECLPLVLNNLGNIELEGKNYSNAFNFYDKSLHISRSVDNKVAAAKTLLLLAHTSMWMCDYSKTAQLGQESLFLYRNLHNPHGIANILYILGLTMLHTKNYTQALEHNREALAFTKNLQNYSLLESWLLNYMVLAANEGQYFTAIKLWKTINIVDGVRHLLGSKAEKELYDEAFLLAQHNLEQEVFQQACEEGELLAKQRSSTNYNQTIMELAHISCGYF